VPAFDAPCERGMAPAGVAKRGLGEQHDLSAEHPDRLEALRTAMEARDQEIKADPLR
jgi:hypothetical protein